MHAFRIYETCLTTALWSRHLPSDSDPDSNSDFDFDSDSNAGPDSDLGLFCYESMNQLTARGTDQPVNGDITVPRSRRVERAVSPPFRSEEPFERYRSSNVRTSREVAKLNLRSESKSVILYRLRLRKTTQNLFLESDSDSGQNCRLRPTPTPASTPTPQHWLMMLLYVA